MEMQNTNKQREVTMSIIKDTGISFKGQEFYVGIDVHKKRWSVTIRNNGLRLKTWSMDPSPEMLKVYLETHYAEGTFHLVYEVGFTGFWICRRLKELGLDCMVVNPADIPTGHKEKDRKTDPVDSNKLARELENGNLEPLYVPLEKDQYLRSLCRLYRRVVQNNTRVKNRIKGHLDYNGIKVPHQSSYWSGDLIKYLYDLPLDNGPAKGYLRLCLEELEEHRQRLVDILKELRHWIHERGEERIIRNLKSVPGIGFKTAMVVYTEIIDIHRFRTLDHLKSYAGLVPSTWSSGETDRVRGLTNRRNSQLKYVLIEAAWVSIRQDPVLLQSYHKLTLRMTKQEAIVRIASKLLNRIKYVWKNDTPYVVGVVE
jgi:transposase